MKTLKISDIYNMGKEEIENLNFHFAKIKDETKIDDKGLKASLGSSSKGEHRR